MIAAQIGSAPVLANSGIESRAELERPRRGSRKRDNGHGAPPMQTQAALSKTVVKRAFLRLSTERGNAAGGRFDLQLELSQTLSTQRGVAYGSFEAAMSRYKGRASAKAIEKDFPYIAVQTRICRVSKRECLRLVSRNLFYRLATLLGALEKKASQQLQPIERLLLFHRRLSVT
jgi:hypothetical protein